MSGSATVYGYMPPVSLLVLGFFWLTFYVTDGVNNPETIMLKANWYRFK